jgi:hypothetical protein
MASEVQQDANFDPDKEFEFLERLGSGYVYSLRLPHWS